MTPKARRSTALSAAQIVDCAIAILDSDGEQALTFRALAARLSTGSGAIYWHVAGKGELLAAATAHVLAPIVSEHDVDEAPRDSVRAISLGLFDVIDAHPWAGAHLARDPGQSAMVSVIEKIGTGITELGVPEHRLFDCTFALVNYIVGVAGQNAANARSHPPGTDRESVLKAVATRWAGLDAETFPFVTRVSEQLAGHDDRSQFVFGIDMFLRGIESAR